MAEDPKKSKLKKYGLSGLNKPKRTPKHPTKKGIVAVKDGEKIKIIRFGDQNISKGKTSAAYWADKFFWAGPSGSKKSPPKNQKVVRGIKRK